MEQSEITPFDWQRIFMDQYPAGFLLEVVFRALIIFVIVMISLRVAGRRGIKQLSIFELVFILTLGSAGGDVIFNENVPVIPVAVTFTAIVGLYVLTVYIISRSERLEKWLEGTPTRVINEGHFVIHYIEKEHFSPEEVCMELRIRSVEHLGQVKYAILETSGELSLFFYPDQDVKPGMPTLPWLRECYQETEAGIHYACARCGNTEEATADSGYSCSRCGHKTCMKALDGVRLD